MILSILRNDIINLGYQVEEGKGKAKKISISILLDADGKPLINFEVDALNKTTGTIIEIEASRAVQGNAFYKDFIEACLINSIDYSIDYLVVAVRNTFKTTSGKFRKVTLYDCDKLTKICKAIIKNTRFKIPLKGILVIGY